MNIVGINYESINDGEGVRTTIFVSGCSHKCPNCHNPQTHDINYGVKFTDELQDEIISNIEKRPFISGVTLSGGDPLHDNNVFDVFNLITKLKDKFPEKNIWLYTGYTWNQIFYPIITDNLDFERDLILDQRKSVVKMCDVLVDGRYIDNLRNVSLRFCGSSNQRVIDVKESLKEKRVVLYN